MSDLEKSKNSAVAELARNKRLGIVPKDEGEIAPKVDEPESRRPFKHRQQREEAEEVARFRMEQERQNQELRQQVSELSGAVKNILDLASEEPEPEPEPLPDPKQDPDGYLTAVTQRAVTPLQRELAQVNEKLTERERRELEVEKRREVEIMGERYVQDLARMREEYEATDEGKGYSDRLNAAYGSWIEMFRMGGFTTEDAGAMAARRLEIWLDEAARLKLNPAYYIDFQLKQGITEAAKAGYEVPAEARGGVDAEVSRLNERASAGSATSLGAEAPENSSNLGDVMRDLKQRVTAETLARAARAKAKREGIDFKDAERELRRTLTEAVA